MLQKCPFICKVRTLCCARNIFGKDNLVRRFNSGDFPIIIPLYAVTENFIYELHRGSSIQISKGQLVLAIEHEGDNIKCLIPYGGSNADDFDNTLPDGFALHTIEVDGDVLQYPQYNGSGTLKVEKGYEFVYALCNIILPGDTSVIRNTRFYVIAVVGDMFDPSSARDVVRLDRSPGFNAQRCRSS